MDLSGSVHVAVQKLKNCTVALQIFADSLLPLVFSRGGCLELEYQHSVSVEVVVKEVTHNKLPVDGDEASR